MIVYRMPPSRKTYAYSLRRLKLIKQKEIHMKHFQIRPQSSEGSITNKINCMYHTPDDATAMIRLFEVRIRKAEEYLLKLSLSKVIDQMLHRVRAQH